jgi:hypothetical protein
MEMYSRRQISHKRLKLRENEFTYSKPHENPTYASPIWHQYSSMLIAVRNDFDDAESSCGTEKLLIAGFAVLEIKHVESTTLDMNSNKALKSDSNNKSSVIQLFYWIIESDSLVAYIPPSESDEPEDALNHSWNKFLSFSYN